MSTELTTSWQNAKNAYSYGLEFEVRKNLDLLAAALSNLTMTGNVALIRSNVELYPRGLETSKERALQGQSPYVINLMLEYLPDPAWVFPLPLMLSDPRGHTAAA